MSPNETATPAILLRELLSLHAATGALSWKVREPRHFTATAARSAEWQCATWNSAHAGKLCFASVGTHGYLHGYVYCRQLSAARTVFAIHTGAWPEQHIDHINGDFTDNRPANLRDVACAENMRNRAISSNNSTGQHGVSLHLGKYDAYITDSGKKAHLGRFDTLEEAVHARKAAERALGYHENHGRAR